MSKKRIQDIPPLEDNLRSKKKIHVSEPENFITVLCRIKKGDQVQEAQLNGANAILVQKNDIEVAEHATSTRPGRRSRFHFDRIYNGSERNEDIFEETLGETVGDVFTQRKNIILFSYGTTGSGKTHTIAGTKSEPGILDLTFQRVFQMCQKKNSKLAFSSFEIYDERIKDLLQDRSVDPRSDFRDFEAGHDGSSFLSKSKYDDTVCETIDSIDKAFELIERAKKNKRIGETLFNKQSSRSHCVYKFTILSPDSFRNCIFVIDLAGAERVNYLNTGNTSATLRETCSINRSLFFLSRCFVALKENSQVPYRQSKLTRVVFDSFVENTKFILLVNLNLSHPNFEDNYSVLEFAAVAKGIKPSVLSDNTTLAPIKKRNAMLDKSMQFLNRKLEGAKQKKEDYISVQEYDLDECFRQFKSTLALKRLEIRERWMAENMRLRNQWNEYEMLFVREMNRDQTRIMHATILKHNENSFNMNLNSSKEIPKTFMKEIESDYKDVFSSGSLSNKHSKASLMCELAEVFPCISRTNSSFKKDFIIPSSKKHTPAEIIDDSRSPSRSPEQMQQVTDLKERLEEKTLIGVLSNAGEAEERQNKLLFCSNEKLNPDQSLFLCRISEVNGEEENTDQKVCGPSEKRLSRQSIKPPEISEVQKNGNSSTVKNLDTVTNEDTNFNKSQEASKNRRGRPATKNCPADSQNGSVTDRSNSVHKDKYYDEPSKSKNKNARKREKNNKRDEGLDEEPKKLVSRYGRDLSKFKQALEAQNSKRGVVANSKSRKRAANLN